MSILCARNYDSMFYYFRGDTLKYTTLVVQDLILEKMKKALAASHHRCIGESEVNHHDVQLVAKMEGDITRYQGEEPEKYAITDLERGRVVRALAHEAGIIRISDRASNPIWEDVLSCFVTSVYETIWVYECWGMTGTIWDNMSCEQFEALMLEPGDPRMKYSPPWTDNGTVVVPGQIKNTAERNGIKVIV